MAEILNQKSVIRSKRVAVPRCQARTTSRPYSRDGHQCPFEAVTELDGEMLCQQHADLWVRGEGHALIMEEPSDA